VIAAGRPLDWGITKVRIKAIHLGICVAGGMVCAMAGPASAGKYTVLYNFCSAGTSQNPCTDGSFPLNGLVMDSTGNLFGTGGAGGANAAGVIFELKAKGRGYSYQTLYSFAACGSSCPDGTSLENPLIVDTSGNLYGVATAGGANGGGTAFELLTSATGKKWTFKVIYAFCAEGGSFCTDGRSPDGGLGYVGASTGALYDGTAPLFGTTLQGGGDSTQGGVVFQLTPGKKWSEKVRYNFCSKSNCADGGTPAGQIAVDTSGNIFGTTTIGGKSFQTNSGVVYRVAGKSETVLHDFCTSNPCHDGTQPGANGVTLGSGQTLVGATAAGGKNGAGAAYQIDVTSHKEDLLYVFCRKANCIDGDTPSGPLALSGSAVIGLTQEGGKAAGGTLFQVAAGGKETVLYAFCQKGGCQDGDNPVGNLVIDGKGNIFGVTQHGGGHNSGTVFEYSP
jgi:hypothetical protein